MHYKRPRWSTKLLSGYSIRKTDGRIGLTSLAFSADNALINYARDQKRLKRGGMAIQVPLSKADAIAAEKSIELIALDDALNRLALIDERSFNVVRQPPKRLLRRGSHD